MSNHNYGEDLNRFDHKTMKKEVGVKKEIKKEYMERIKKEPKERKRKYKEKKMRMKKEVKCEDEEMLKGMKKDVMEERGSDSKRKKVIPLADPDIPPPWKVYLSMRKMRCYYHNHDTRESTWEREDVEKWKKEHKIAPVVQPLNELRVSNLINEDIQFIQEIRHKSNSITIPSLSLPTRSCHLGLSSDSIAIFDTSALIDLPEILRITVRHQVVAVIPYTVIQELDVLKKSGRETVVRPAIRVHKSLDDLSSKNHPLLILESGREVSSPS
ncbi:hypothetical protein PMAYCL1PPCAC_07189 [Pristionchus mayeri]|uniref:WW domain-containing protein n=1 Tax=Pristionchus mayeri TaxID=1317129 RepID=A0AAN5CC79_9BILA|nr:hypothetical protein PMAYCL1PPCAC_07189 [Pristionchus mayeri]